MLITELIENEVLAKVDLNAKIKKSVQKPAAFHFTICGLDWLPLTWKIEIDGVKYDVKVSDDSSYQYMIDVVLVAPSVFKFLKFHFFTGSPIDVTRQFSTKSNVVSEKTPFVWLPLTSAPRLKVTGDRTKAFPYRYSNLRVFFLGSTYYDRWNDKQRMENVIRYIDDFATRFVQAMTLNGKFNHNVDYDLLPLVKFANTSDKGFMENILDATQLSAIELDLTFQTEIYCQKCKT